MTSTLLVCLIVPLLLTPTAAIGQKMKVVFGNFEFLRGQTNLNVVFDYTGATFYNEKMSEQDYVDKRMEEISKDKGADEAEVWRKDWDYSKSTTFVNKFLASMNKNLTIKSSADDAGAKYTVIVQTTWIYPGWFAGVMAQGAKVSTVLRFVETADHSKVLLEIDSQKAPGDIKFVGIPNNNDRMSEGYAKTGKTLAALIEKKLN
ncbi:hypothetical protein [Sphingobacterium suaedae]|uniref:DUF4410 domain-containing protein n=1 Tax=Sphingobacterium suaedae TaxID=1686402 RepID=A0ABW5KK40_9SPHI